MVLKLIREALLTVLMSKLSIREITVLSLQSHV